MPDNQPPLLPCPFCGDIKSLDAAEALGQHIDGCPTIAAGCENCGAIGPEVSYTGGKQVPIPTPPELLARSAERWNSRPASPVTRSAEVEKALARTEQRVGCSVYTKLTYEQAEHLRAYIAQLEASQPTDLLSAKEALSELIELAPRTHARDMAVKKLEHALARQPKPQSDEILAEYYKAYDFIYSLMDKLESCSAWDAVKHIHHLVSSAYGNMQTPSSLAALSRQAPVVMQTAVDWAEEIGRTANSFCKASGSRYYDPLKAAGIIQQAIDHGRWELRHAPNVTSSRWAAQVVRCLKQMFPNWEKGYDWTNGSYENSQFSFSQQRANEAIDAIRKYEDYLIKGDFGFVADRSAMRSTAFEEGRKSALADGKLREALEKMLTCRLRRDVAKPHGWSITSLNKEADSAQQVLDTLAQPASGDGE